MTCIPNYFLDSYPGLLGCTAHNLEKEAKKTSERERLSKLHSQPCKNSWGLKILFLKKKVFEITISLRK